MQKVFSKSNFPQALGGNLYEFSEAETGFNISENGFYVIKVVAKAKNSKQNSSTDDDDLRMTIDDYSFGKYEQNESQMSWKGFNTSASWNGAKLKNELKTVYFLLNLDKGTHTLRFFADNRPEIVSMEVFKLENYSFKIDEALSTKWVSFIFLNTYPKIFALNLDEISNSKILEISLNGSVLSEEQINEKIDLSNTIYLTDDDIAGQLPFENSIELCLQSQNEAANIKISFIAITEYLDSIEDIAYLRNISLKYIRLASFYFQHKDFHYSHKFLEYSLEHNPAPLIFTANHPLVRKIKADPAFIQIINVVKLEIETGNLDGEIIPRNINFETEDLATSIHGIKKIEYTAKPILDHKFEVKIVLYDVYDFEKIHLPAILNPIEYIKASVINGIDMSEELGILSNFEVQIHINQTL